MKAPVIRTLLYALLIGGMASPCAYAAAAVSSGSQDEQKHQAAQTLRPRAPIGSRAAAMANSKAPALARALRSQAVVAGTVRRTPPRSFAANQSRGQVGTLAMSTRPAALAPSPTMRGTGALASAATLRQPLPTFKPSVGLGVIGGPHVINYGRVGGPANARTAVSASINGAAVHRH